MRGAARAAAGFESAAAPALRPLKSRPRTEIATLLEGALRAGDGARGAHCIHELWMRGEFAATIEAALGALWERAAASIPEWLPMRYIDCLPAVYEVTGAFAASRPGRSNIYLVLLDFEDRRRGPYGLYVGMSRYPPLQRFDQHKAGIHSSGSVLKRGLEPLTGPTLHLQRIARSEALRIEAALAAALADTGLIIEGGH